MADHMNLRRFAVIGAVVAAVLTPLIQSLFDLGLSQGEFASAGDGTLRAARYAFSIWSVIYLWLIAYAAYQALPQV